MAKTDTRTGQTPQVKTSKNMRFARMAVLLVAFLAMGGYVYFHFDEFAVIKQFNPWALVPLFVAHFLYIFVFSYIFRMLIAKFGIKLKFHEYFGMAITKTFANYFLPARLGMTTNSIYLKKRAGLSYSHFASFFMAQTILITASSAFYGLIGTFLSSHFYNDGKLSVYLYSFFGCMLLGIAAVVSFSPRIKNPKSRVGKIMARVLDGWHIIKTDKMLFVKIFICGFCCYSLAAVTIKSGFNAFGIHIPFKAAFLAGILGSFVNYINLTPANLGIQEPFFALLSRILGLGFNQGLIVSGINRMVQMTIVFALVPFYTWYLTRSGKRIENTREQTGQQAEPAA